MVDESAFHTAVDRFLTGATNLSPTSNKGDNFWSSSVGKILAGAQKVPSFNFADQITKGIGNPLLRLGANLPLSIAQSYANTPSDLVQGPINLAKDVNTHQLNASNALPKVASDIAPTLEGGLNVASLGLGSGLLKGLGKGLLPSLAQGAAMGGTYGAGYGGINALAQGGNTTDPSSYAKNLLMQSLMGGSVGALAGGALGGAGYGAGKLGSKIAQAQASPNNQAGFFAGASAVGVKPSTPGLFSSLMDKRTRFEVSDKDSTLTKDAVSKMNQGAKLGDILDQPALFKAYPQLKDIKVLRTALPDARAEYSPEENTIYVNALDLTKDQMLPSLLHEVQHAIQTTEAFPTGGQAAEGNLPMNVYKNLASEIEARSTASRQGLTQDQRMNTLPYQEQNIPLKDVITNLIQSKPMDKNTTDPAIKNALETLQSYASAQQGAITPPTSLKVDPSKISPKIKVGHAITPEGVDLGQPVMNVPQGNKITPYNSGGKLFDKAINKSLPLDSVIGKTYISSLSSGREFTPIKIVGNEAVDARGNRVLAKGLLSGDVWKDTNPYKVLDTETMAAQVHGQPANAKHDFEEATRIPYPTDKTGVNGVLAELNQSQQSQDWERVKTIAQAVMSVPDSSPLAIYRPGMYSLIARMTDPQAFQK